MERSVDFIVMIGGYFLGIPIVVIIGLFSIFLEEYRFIFCYLDNDLAGQKTVETIASLYEGRVDDMSSAYSEYKDLNDYIRDKKL